MTDFAAAMWNHAPKMAAEPAALSSGEMRQVVAYLWTLQVFDRPGHPDRGQKVFAGKNCALCHNDPSTGAPNLAGLKGKTDPFTMVAALWQHGPNMWKKAQQKQLEWPRFTAPEMVDLIAYLNGTPK